MYTLVSYNISLVMTICPSRRDTFQNFTPPEIFLERLKLETSNFVYTSYKLATKSITLVMTDYSPSGRSKGHVTYFYILGPRPYLWSG